MKKLKVSELFYSLQGEGKYVGQPSVFLRLFGCNLKCEGFGMPSGQKSTERFDIRFDDLSQYNSISDLPLVSTGCDSYASWDSRFKRFSPTYSIDEVVDQMLALLPGQPDHWDNENIHLVITGGEPLLPGWQKILPDLIRHYKLVKLKYITIETNGTKELTNDFQQFVYACSKLWTFSVSPKLSASGEPMDKTIKPKAIASYVRARATVYAKYVCQTENDIKEAIAVHDEFNNELLAIDHIPMYIMPAGGMHEQYKNTSKTIAALCMKYGVTFTPRLHIDLFGNKWAT